MRESETDEIQLVDLRRVLKVPDLHTIHCLNSRYRKETLATVRAAGEQSVSIAPVSVTKLSRMTEIDSLKIAAVAPLSMVVLLVAFNVSWDSKMKEPLIVMNAGRFSILLASIICNFFLTVLSVSIVFVVAVVFNEKLPIFVVFVALLLLALGSVIFGVLCGTVFPDAINSIKLAIVLWGLACYFGFAAPPIYERYWLVLANQVNIVAAFNNILQSCEYQELRGIPVSFSTVFAYTDIVNPGISFIFMAADIIMCLTALVCYELIDWADMYTGTHMWLSRKKLASFRSFIFYLIWRYKSLLA
ncbi:unnamed protein product [Heligmosomoides polygyrus]|uniref:ABC2_membrane domain-containing protein n=1 Tax=Heligmosomoides polygyrus TaxID=6339 RepID=A0A183GJ68_HELPZ|nr:unnamed protein product [Heligmosomoides polygyrus]